MRPPLGRSAASPRSRRRCRQTSSSSPASQNTTTTILGTTAAYSYVRNTEIWQGSFLTDASVEFRIRVAVLGATTADDLGLGASSIGSTIRIGGLPFEVVGILQSKGSTGPFSEDDQVIVPLTTLGPTSSAVTAVRTINLSVDSAADMEAVKANLALTLEQRHGITSSANDDFTIADQSQLLATVDSVSGLLSVLLAGIASISLIVGGIGIMNIMLVSVRERTREIGIRKAVGARNSDILRQFLVEALVLSLAGGVIGIVLGTAISALIGALAGWGFLFNPLTGSSRSGSVSSSASSSASGPRARRRSSIRSRLFASSSAHRPVPAHIEIGQTRRV